MFTDLKQARRQRWLFRDTVPVRVVIILDSGGDAPIRGDIIYMDTCKRTQKNSWAMERTFTDAG